MQGIQSTCEIDGKGTYTQRDLAIGMTYAYLANSKVVVYLSLC